MATLPSPVESEALSMPCNHPFWLYNNQSGSPASPQPGKPNPQEAVSSAQTNAMPVVRALRDQELMAQGKDFSSQGCPSSEAGWHGEKQGDGKSKHGSSSLHAPRFTNSTVSIRTAFLVGAAAPFDSETRSFNRNHCNKMIGVNERLL
jgi:hypothetical protein